MKIRFSCSLPALLMLAGCLAPPPVGQPRAPGAPPAASQSLPASAGAAWPVAQWWQSYGDAQLPQLIAEGLAGSPDVASAAARLARARAMADSAHAALLPHADANASAGAERESLQQGFPAQFIALLPHGFQSEGSLNASFGFDPDVWGNNRAKLAAATSEARAARIDAEAARLALASAIAEAYVGLAGDIDARGVRAAALADAEGSARLINDRFQHGLDNRASLDATGAAAASARAQLSAAEAQVVLRRDQIAALMGAGPDRGRAITDPALAPLATHELPAGVATGLVGRRADIAAARARADAAFERVRAARAEYFPSIRLNALAGFQSIGLAQLLTTNAMMASIGPAVSLPIFHGGAIRAGYHGARADADAALAEYDRAVVAAYQQAADAYASRAALIRQRDDAARAVALSEGAARLTAARYKAGLGTQLDVLSGNDRLLAARAALSAYDTAARSADIALIRALGGGYDGSPSPQDSQR